MHWTSATLAAILAGGPFVTAQAPLAPPGPGMRFLVVLDAAHGGDDAGGRLSNGQLEKDLTLALGVRLRSLLGARSVQVLNIREKDTTIEMDRRAEMANHADAQACLSLHATESGSGVHLFVSSLSPGQPAHLQAWKTAQAAWVNRSISLAGVLNSALLHAGMTVTLSRAALPGVDSMTCPAVAVEIAPERDASQQMTAGLDNADYQARVAGALVAALLEWHAEVQP